MKKQAIITFRVGTTISGKSIAEIKSKFEAMNIPAELEYIELCSVEDAETRDDLMDIWDNDQNLCKLEDVDDFIKTLENGKKEDEAMQNGLNFLLKQWETNKKWFREQSGRVTTEDVINRTFEFAWASKRNFDYQQQNNN